MNLINLPKHKDSRGSIQMILDVCSIGSISRIDSLAGTTRAKHWHRNDGHFIETLVGEVWLFERPVGSSDCPKLIKVKVGDIAFTGPNIEHEMFFPQFTVFNCYSLLPRQSHNYENETVRFDYSLREIYNAFHYQN